MMVSVEFKCIFRLIKFHSKQHEWSKTIVHYWFVWGRWQHFHSQLEIIIYYAAKSWQHKWLIETSCIALGLRILMTIFEWLWQQWHHPETLMEGSLPFFHVFHMWGQKPCKWFLRDQNSLFQKSGRGQPPSWIAERLPLTKWPWAKPMWNDPWLGHLDIHKIGAKSDCAKSQQKCSNGLPFCLLSQKAKHKRAAENDNVKNGTANKEVLANNDDKEVPTQCSPQKEHQNLFHFGQSQHAQLQMCNNLNLQFSQPFLCPTGPPTFPNAFMSVDSMPAMQNWANQALAPVVLPTPPMNSEAWKAMWARKPILKVKKTRPSGVTVRVSQLKINK